MKDLAKILITYDVILKHNWVLKSTKVYCIYCWNNQLNWQSKYQQWWSFETDITNIEDDSEGDSESDSESQFWESRTWWRCDQCNISLCEIENYWCLWHENLN